jgi:hypothetical protein
MHTRLQISSYMAVMTGTDASGKSRYNGSHLSNHAGSHSGWDTGGE